MTVGNSTCIANAKVAFDSTSVSIGSNKAVMGSLTFISLKAHAAVTPVATGSAPIDAFMVAGHIYVIVNISGDSGKPAVVKLGSQTFTLGSSGMIVMLAKNPLLPCGSMASRLAGILCHSQVQMGYS